jgi:hypothetical protein
MDYGLILTIAAYFVGIQVVAKFNLKPLTGALIAIGIPFIVSSIVRWILFGAHLDAIWGEAINVTSVLVCIIQGALMYVLLRHLKSTDSIAAYLILGVVGFIVIVLFIPFAITKLL